MWRGLEGRWQPKFSTWPALGRKWQSLDGRWSRVGRRCPGTNPIAPRLVQESTATTLLLLTPQITPPAQEGRIKAAIFAAPPQALVRSIAEKWHIGYLQSGGNYKDRAR